ncbi:MAG: hypothetical protein HY860_05190 [Chlamydiales bacterium]|nr:hypothetical protein [Chlamydiales bacterium]
MKFYTLSLIVFCSCLFAQSNEGLIEFGNKRGLADCCWKQGKKEEALKLYSPDFSDFLS